MYTRRWKFEVHLLSLPSIDAILHSIPGKFWHLNLIKCRPPESRFQSSKQDMVRATTGQCVCVCVCVCVWVCMCTLSLSCVWFFVTPWAIVHQAPVFMGFSRQEYWSKLPLPAPVDLLHLATEPKSLASPALAGRFFTAALPGKLLPNSEPWTLIPMVQVSGGASVFRHWHPQHLSV